MLIKLGQDGSLGDVAMEDYRQVALEPKVRRLLDFAVQVTLDVHAVSPATLDTLREAGWEDAAILEAVEIIGFFNYYNRMADALGVEPEPEWG
ncbi:MAG TPA: hypothetical protein VH540_12720 [Ktedonobacterales bacterium]